MSDTTTPATPAKPAAPTTPTTPTPWTLCLQSSQGRNIIRLEQPGITSTADLYRLASTELLLCGNGDGNGNGKSHTSIASLKYGFPPKPLPQDDTVMITSILQNQERLQVVTTTTTTTTNATTAATATATYATKSKGNGNGKGKGRKGTTSLEASSLTSTPPGNPTDTTTATDTTTTPATATRKSKRAAAQRATENMPAVIQAQEEFMKSQQQQQQQRSSSSSTKKNSAKRPRRTATTTNPTSNPTPTTPAPTTRTTKTTFAASVGQGRRLADGVAMAAPSNRSRRPRPRRGGAGSNTTGNNAKQQQPADMSEALLGALNDSGKMGQVLRKGMKNAVQASYETTRAFSRLAAIQSKSYTMTTTMTMTTTVGGAVTVADTTTSNTGRLKVQYRGSVDKTAMTTEEVDGIPRDVLEAVIRGIHASNPEALRPENVALLSPRVLWSLVHHFPNCITVADMYQQLVPSSTSVSTSVSVSTSTSSTNITPLDWTFLRRRAPQLSEKALENIRQAQEDETTNSKTLDTDDDNQKASEAIAAVEHAMEHLQDYAATERQARQATAALQRLQHQEDEQSTSSSCSSSSKWMLVTPSEPDQDELRDCIVSEDNDNDNATNPEILSSNDHQIMTSQWIQQLMQRCHIHNWRELANVEDAAALAKSLHLPIDQVQSWISRAQDQSVDEIIVEICDGNVQAVELLMERARSGTPKDLASWRRIPNLLHQRLQKVVDEAVEEAAPVDQKDDAATSTTTNMTLQQVGTWTTRAHQVIQEYEWLNWYATPVE